MFSLISVAIIINVAFLLQAKLFIRILHFSDKNCDFISQ